MEWIVPYIDLKREYRSLRTELIKIFDEVMDDARFIQRRDLSLLERRLAEYIGTKHIIGVNSGTDALYLSTYAAGLKTGDEVITVAHSFVATVASIFHRGSKPIFVDIGEDYNMNSDLIEKLVTPFTRAIMPVHLNGRTCKMDKILEIAKKHNLIIIEDAAQAIGSLYKRKMAGSHGLFGCFSLHPMKTLSCAGDGGFISTNDDSKAEELRMLRNHGQKTKEDIAFFGYNSRLDNLQAALLNVKLNKLTEMIEMRREIARFYSCSLSELPLILPPSPSNGDHYDTFNSYVIRTKKREGLLEHLRNNGIEAFVHISKPLYHHSTLNLPRLFLPVNEKICKETISLPIYPEMSKQQRQFVVLKIKEFFRK